jgi:hypothetical protein
MLRARMQNCRCEIVQNVIIRHSLTTNDAVGSVKHHQPRFEDRQRRHVNFRGNGIVDMHIYGSSWFSAAFFLARDMKRHNSSEQQGFAVTGLLFLSFL